MYSIFMHTIELNLPPLALDILLYLASFVVEKSANVGNKLTTYKFPSTF